MPTKLDLESLVAAMRQGAMGQNVEHVKELPAREARFEDWPEGLDERIVAAYRARGIERPYSHQAEAIGHALAGRNFTVVTPTASGKTLCYNAPALSAMMKNNKTRALYVFPTKALSQDQSAELQELIEAAGGGIGAHTYDGDTPTNVRKTIRNVGNIVVTNPDMLHSGILPHHTKWVHLFKELKYVVIDEVHTYRGVFGSHFANIMRRLKRIAAFYESEPQYICCSATIANPKELSEKLIEAPMELVDDNGAPRGKKVFMFYNPPVINEELGVRASPIMEAQRIANDLLANDISTIVFGKSRKSTENLVTYMKDAMEKRCRNPALVRGYRGGYLPKVRREIEHGLRTGDVMGVAATNALELGIDIGSLDACVMAGYPGAIASAWQQSGRAGRKSGLSLTVLVASSHPLDQYVMAHPEYFFGTPPEHGMLDADNLQILAEHIKCAAFELPFKEGERFGNSAYTEDVLDILDEARFLHQSGGQWHWSTDIYPADHVSLRSATTENFIVMDFTHDNKIVGEVDLPSAPEFIHEKAIYQVESQQYLVERLDYDGRRAYVKPVEVDYYTEANSESKINVLEKLREEGRHNRTSYFGVVRATTVTTMYKKIRFHTLENVGSGPVAIPELEKQTVAYWLSLTDEIAHRLDAANFNLRSSLLAVKSLLKNLVPAHVMCAPQDVGGVMETRAPLNGRPTVYLYDAYPGGVGIAEKIFELEERILAGALEHARNCPCEAGCPSCVGPANAIGPTGKAGAIDLLANLI